MNSSFNWSEVSRVGYDAFIQGNYDRAEQIFRQAIDHGNFSRQDLRLADSFLLLAKCLSQKGEWISAESMYAKAQDIYESIHGRMHEDVASTVSGRGKCLYQSGRFRESLSQYLKALAIYQYLSETFDEDTATCIDSIALNYLALRDYRRAYNHYEKLLVLQRKIYGPDDGSLANTLFSMAKCIDELNEFRAAADLFKRSLELYETQECPDLEQLANCRYNLARCYQSCREFLKAEPLYLKSMNYFQGLRGMEKNTAYCTFALATCYLASGDYRAEAMLKKSGKLYEKVFGRTHMQYVYWLDAYSRYLYNTSRLSEARRLEDSAREIRIKLES